MQEESINKIINTLDILSVKICTIEKSIFYLVFITAFFGAAFFTIDLGSFTLFPYRIFLLFLLIVFSLKTIFNGKIIFYQKYIVRYLFLLFFWLGYSIISLAWSISEGDAIKNILFLSMGILLIYFSTYYIKNKVELKRLFVLWMICFGILIVIGFWEHLTGNHFSTSAFYKKENILPIFKSTGVFYNTNDYATFLSLSIPFALAIFHHYKQILYKLVGISFILSASYLIIETRSRANIIAVLLEIIFIFLFLKDINKKLKTIVIISVLIPLMFVFFGSSISPLYERVVKEITSIRNETNLMAGSMGIRINLFKNGIHFLCLTGGLGVGAGNVDKYMENSYLYNTAGILNLHNWWLEILVNYGILIFFGYILFYIGIMFNLWKIFKKNLSKIEKVICEALLVALIGFSVASMSPSSILTFKPQWLLFAFALSFINYFNRKKEIEKL